MMKHLLAITTLFLSTISFCQEGKLIGKVLDENGEPIMGASIIFRKDVTIGVHSDDLGNYELDIPAGNSRIVCRYSGMITDTFNIDFKQYSYA